MPPKAFMFRESVEFRRAPGSLWEPGTYVKEHQQGWHWVRAENATDKFLVPTRRLRPVTGTPPAIK